MKLHKNLFQMLILAVIFFSPNSLNAAVIAQDVEYKDGDTVLQGYLAYDDAIQGKRPGVIVVHEWKGLNDYSKSRARQLAELGYAALAADIYGKGVRPESHEEAGKISGAYKNNRVLTRARGKAALDFLKSREQTDPEKIAAIGYCFGGMAVLEMARAGFDLKGVASFHGSLATPTPAEPGTIKAKVMVFHGAADKFISEEEVKTFKDEMANAGVNFQFVPFEGAVHSFTVPSAGSDPSTGVAYNEDADKRSWAMLVDFLNDTF